MPEPSESDIAIFVDTVLRSGSEHYRDFTWRTNRDPYAILVSEVMLQQTQASRVVPYFDEWMSTFPDLESLADAPLQLVLSLWRGLGYNRRGLWLKQAAERTVAEHRASWSDGRAELPADLKCLLALPGIGPSTAAGIMAFGFGLPAVYLETNVRTVFLHELYADAQGVPDSAIVPLVERAMDEARGRGIGVAEWYYALLDHGAFLKRTVPNPSRRSAHHATQSRFEGSRRQKRAWLLRAVMDEPGLGVDEYAARLARQEEDLGRQAPSVADVTDIIDALTAEGLLAIEDGRVSIP